MRRGWKKLFPGLAGGGKGGRGGCRYTRVGADAEPPPRRGPSRPHAVFMAAAPSGAHWARARVSAAAAARHWPPPRAGPPHVLPVRVKKVWLRDFLGRVCCTDRSCQRFGLFFNYYYIFFKEEKKTTKKRKKKKNYQTKKKLARAACSSRLAGKGSGSPRRGQSAA